MRGGKSKNAKCSQSFSGKRKKGTFQGPFYFIEKYNVPLFSLLILSASIYFTEAYSARIDENILFVLCYGDKDVIVPIQHALNLDHPLETIGLTSELVVNHGIAGAGEATRATAFVTKYLLSP